MKNTGNDLQNTKRERKRDLKYNKEKEMQKTTEKEMKNT